MPSENTMNRPNILSIMIDDLGNPDWRPVSREDANHPTSPLV